MTEFLNSIDPLALFGIVLVVVGGIFGWIINITKTIAKIKTNEERNTEAVKWLKDKFVTHLENKAAI